MAGNAGNRKEGINVKAGTLQYCVIKSKAEVSKGVRRVTVGC
jgi:hypothetical protein